MTLLPLVAAACIAPLLLSNNLLSLDHDGIAEKLREFEGYQPTVYTCPMGYPTIGYGHRIQVSQGEAIPGSMSRIEADVLLMQDIQAAEDGARRVYKDFDELPLPAREALVHMAFQLGSRGLSAFTNLKKQIQKRNWAGAGMECMHSRWSAQTPRRALYCAQLFGSIK